LRSQYERVASRGRAVLELIGEVESAAQSWERQSEALLENESGKAIAASENLVDAFENLRREPRPSVQTLTDLSGTVEGLLRPVRSAIDNDEFHVAPDVSLTAELDHCYREAEEMKKKYNGHLSRLDALLEDAKAVSAPGDVSLQEAIKRLHAKYAHQQNEIVAKAAVEQRQIEAEKMAVIERKRIADEEATRREKAEKDRLIKLAEDPTIQALYSPFLEKGRTSASSDNSGRGWYFYSYNGPSRTVRYSAMQRFDMFTDFSDFLVAATSSHNDRRTWRYPKTDEEWAEYQKRFELFKELAPVWVELGLIDK